MSDTTGNSVEVSRAADNSAVLDAMNAIRSGNAVAYSSIEGEDFDTRLQILEAVTSSSPVGENLGKIINLKNIVIQAVQFTDEASGEVSDQPRIVFIDDEGVAYHATSTALLRGVNQLIGLLGEPKNWGGKTVPVRFVTAGKAPRQYFTMEFGNAIKGSTKK